METRVAELSRFRRRKGRRLNLARKLLRLPELVLYDHIGFKGAYARTNLSFHYIGDFWNDRMSCRHRRERRLAILSRRLLQGALLGSRPGLLRKLFCRKRPRRRRQLVSVHRADIG